MMPHPSEGLKVVTIRIAAITGVTGIASITAVSGTTISATILRPVSYTHLLFASKWRGMAGVAEWRGMRGYDLPKRS